MSTSRMLIGVATILALAGSASAQAFFSSGDDHGQKRVVVRKAAPKSGEKAGPKAEKQVRVEVRAGDGEPKVWVSGDDDDAPGQKRIIVRKIEGQRGEDCDDCEGGDCDDCAGDDCESGTGGHHEVHVFGVPGGKTMTFRAHGGEAHAFAMPGGERKTIQLRAFGGGHGVPGGGQTITLRGVPGDGPHALAFRGTAGGRAFGGEAKGECCEACGRPFENAGPAWRGAPAQPKALRFNAGKGAKGDVRILRKSEGGQSMGIHGYRTQGGEPQVFTFRTDGEHMAQLHEHLAQLGGGHHEGNGKAKAFTFKLGEGGDAEVKVEGKVIIVGPDGKVIERQIGAPKRGPRSDAAPGRAPEAIEVEGMPLGPIEVEGMPLGPIEVQGMPLNVAPVEGVRIAPVIETRKSKKRGGVL